MQWERIILITVLMISFSIAGLLALMAFRRRKQTGTKEFLGFSVAIMIFIFGYIFEIASNTLPEMLNWLKIQYLGLPFVSFFWLLLSIRYTGWEGKLKPYLVRISLLITLVVIVLHSTNELHHLYYKEVKFEGQGPFPTFSVTQGPWYWIYTIYLNLVVLVADCLLIKFGKQAPLLFRNQIKTMLLVSIIPVTANLIYQFRLIFWEPSPVAFVFSGLLIAGGLFKQKLFDLAPIARDKIFESINDGVIVLDLDNRMVDFNPAAKLIMPELDPSFLGRNILQIFAQYQKLTRQVIGNLEEIEFETESNESKRWIVSRLAPIAFKQEGAVGRMLVINDITSQKKAQAHLVQAEKMAVLGQLVANVSHEMNTPIAAIKATAENMIESHSRFFDKLELILEEIDVKEKPLFLEVITKVQRAPQLSAREEREAFQKVMGFTQTRNLTNADTAAGYFVKLGIAEEFPRLAPTLQDSKSAALLNLILEIALWRRDLQNILLAQEKTLKTLFALKSYSHAPIERRLVSTDIRANIEIVLQLYHNLLKRGIRTEVNAKPVPEIMAYPDELQQVWTNIIYNAIQAMEGKGELVINIGSEADQVVVGIIDNGPGIPEQNLPKLFNPFFTTKRAGEGSGLGLNICRQIIEAHHGRITIQSKPGRTEVLVYLPAKKPNRQSER